MIYVAHIVKGLAQIAKEELWRSFNDLKIVEVSDKHIIFNTESGYNNLAKLKTVDDIGLFLGKTDKISTSNDLLLEVEKIDFEKFKEIIKSKRIVENSFSLTIGFINVRGIKPLEAINEISSLLIKKYGCKFTPLDHTNLDIRLVLNKSELLISIRLTPESLHNRKYKSSSKQGSLKPTIAAAMISLATKGVKNLKIVDNFCGSGTILCESLLSNNIIYGGDIDSESVQNTLKNLINLNYSSEDKIKVLDATMKNWPEGYFDCAISNLPWNEQIKVTSITDLYNDSLREYKRILKPTGTLCALISKPDLFVKLSKKYFPEKKIELFKLGLLGQNPTIILIQ